MPTAARAVLARALATAVALSAGPLAPSAAHARETLSIAAASSLAPALEALRAAFAEERPDADVAVTVGASGTFFAQLGRGAPFDLFLSADREYPRRLVEAGLASPEGEVVYAVGALVVWVPESSPLAPELAARGLAALAGPRVRQLAIANPAVAPWGRAAEAALRSAGILDAVRARLVLGQGVSQAAQFAERGAADAALVPRALALSPALRRGRVFPVPADAYPRQEQSLVVLRAARSPELARAFVRFVTGPKGRELLLRAGWSPP